MAIRTLTNVPGATYDEEKTDVFYAEDYNELATAVQNLEEDTDDTILSRSFVITNPTALSDLPLWRVPVGITIQAVHLLCKGNVTIGQLFQYDSNGLNGATIDSSDITGIVDTNVNDDGTLSAPVVTALNYIGWKTTSVTGTPTYAIITFDYIITH